MESAEGNKHQSFGSAKPKESLGRKGELPDGPIKWHEVALVSKMASLGPWPFAMAMEVLNHPDAGIQLHLRLV